MESHLTGCLCFCKFDSFGVNVLSVVLLQVVLHGPLVEVVALLLS